MRVKDVSDVLCYEILNFCSNRFLVQVTKNCHVFLPSTDFTKVLNSFCNSIVCTSQSTIPHFSIRIQFLRKLKFGFHKCC